MIGWQRTRERRAAVRRDSGGPGSKRYPSREESVLHLQRLAGNRAVAAALRSAPEVIQRVGIKVLDNERADLRTETHKELTDILEAAEKAKGGARTGGMLKDLQGLLAELQGAVPGTQSTYGLSGVKSKKKGGATVGVEGSTEFQESAERLKGTDSPFWKKYPNAEILPLGNRTKGGKSHLHDEMVHVRGLPSASAMVATQRNCIFCYGYLELWKYAHEELREKPWPDGWKHPDAGFELIGKKEPPTITGPTGDVETRKVGPQILISPNLPRCTPKEYWVKDKHAKLKELPAPKKGTEVGRADRAARRAERASAQELGQPPRKKSKR